ncbi:MAG TPA: hypothetical protein VFI08_10025 [Spirochaetia bacterium]|nr:hypothetical protein [Spirochaetia bacterium]
MAMRKALLSLAMTVVLPLCAAAQSGSASSSAAGATPGPGGCPDPVAVVRAFYLSNDAGKFAESARFLADDVKFDTWATGVNGYMMAQRHLLGKKALRAFLADARGVRHRLPDSPPDGPVYKETRLKVTGNTVDFMLEPDRLRPNGRPYNPFSIEVVLDGCVIKTLTVIERVTWL